MRIMENSKEKITIFFVSFILIYLIILIYVIYQDGYRGFFTYVTTMTYLTILFTSLIISLAITFSIHKKGINQFLTCFVILSIWSIVSAIAILITLGSNAWWWLYLPLMLIGTMIVSLIIVFAINPLIRKFYLKQT